MDQEIPRFNCNEDISTLGIKWKKWKRSFEIYINAKGITDDLRKKNLLLHCAGPEVQDIFFTLPESEDETIGKQYDLARIALDNYFSPKANTVYERYIFRSIKQKPGETMEQFITKLKQQGKNCNYTDLDDQIRDQVIEKGLSTDLRRKFLERGDLKLDEVREIAKAYEATEMQLHSMEKPSPTVEVNKVQYKNKPNWKKGKEEKKVSGNSNGKEEKKVSGNSNKCFRCGDSRHLANSCKFINTKCNFCNRKGHLEKVCFRKKKASECHEVSTNSDCQNDVLNLYQVSSTDLAHRRKFYCSISVEGKRIKFEFDSGAAVTVIGKKDFHDNFPNRKIIPSDIKLFSYGGNPLKVLGYATVKVIYKNTGHMLNLYVVESNNIPLFGREWIRQLNLDFGSIFDLNSVVDVESSDLKKVILHYKPLFQNYAGKIVNVQARLRLKENSKPVFAKSRSIPFSMQENVKNELESLINQGILEPVNTSEWASAIVPVVKRNGQIRICGDYKPTLNPGLVVDDYPLPTIDELFANMAGGEKFTKLDITQAYLHLEVHPDDRELLTLNTIKGLLRPTRLMYGVASAPAIWQKEIEKILQGIDGLSIFFDDIRITAPNEELHLKRLCQVLDRFKQFNVKVNFEKCTFLADAIEYCGYVINKDGIHKSKKKVETIKNIPRPTNRDELRTY